jgi:hypothetical protein
VSEGHLAREIFDEGLVLYRAQRRRRAGTGIARNLVEVEVSDRIESIACLDNTVRGCR